jgi:hypothetical protein
MANSRRIASAQVEHRSEPSADDSCLQRSHCMATSFPKDEQGENRFPARPPIIQRVFFFPRIDSGQADRSAFPGHI